MAASKILLSTKEKTIIHECLKFKREHAYEAMMKANKSEQETLSNYIAEINSLIAYIQIN